MKKIFILLLLSGISIHSFAQTDTLLYEGTFKKAKLMASSNPYKPDKWEKPYYEKSIKTAFPSDLMKHPDKYKDKLIHLIGIVDSVYFDTTKIVVRLENKYWDYIEDYSIQDEKMFISESGDGKFLVTISVENPSEYEFLKEFPKEKKLFLVYGNFEKILDAYPLLSAQKIKIIDYKFYTTKVFYYDVLRDETGEIVCDKTDRAKLTNFKILKIAGTGQNK